MFRILNPITMICRYSQWLHLRWPSGRVEKLPVMEPDGTTTVEGVRIVGDLTGIPLLKFSADSGARAVQALCLEPRFQQSLKLKKNPELFDLAIIGGGISGVAAAMEAQKNGLHFRIFEANQLFSTVSNFPKAKPIYTYPTEMVPAGDLQFHATTKETLLEEMEAQWLQAGIETTVARIERVERKDGELLLHHSDKGITRARRVIIAIGRSGNFRKLNVPGETLDKVSNRLHDPADFVGKNVLVVGAGDSALEAAISLCDSGAKVMLSARSKELSRPKPENRAKLLELAQGSTNDLSGSLTLALGSQVKEILPHEVTLVLNDGTQKMIANDAVFTMLGREAPLDFFRRSGIRIQGEWKATNVAAMLLFITFCFWLYHWKGTKDIPFYGHLPDWLAWRPTTLWLWLTDHVSWLAPWLGDPSTLLGTLKISASGPSFYYTLSYSIIILVFGLKRIRRRQTPYVTVQTTSLILIQWLPLFLLPEIILPLVGHNGLFNQGWLKALADEFFPLVKYDHGREYWRAYGLILAWPLFVYNWFTAQPMVGWLIVGFIQTFVIIPLIVWRWGKGAYCGWICSCGALAETLGDQHRHKMPHGSRWNRLNMLGQVILIIALLLMLCRILGWLEVGWAQSLFEQGFRKMPLLNYSWTVDVLLAGILGYGFYFWYSGRMWCRFACPLAALMHIYARFSRFRIFAEKSKCISCNVCTSVCHQGIDVMDFANKGLPMEDPQCVRCSACVQSCPTGVLSFGRYGEDARIILDTLPASRVQRTEAGKRNLL